MSLKLNKMDTNSYQTTSQFKFNPIEYKTIGDDEFAYTNTNS